MKKTSQILSNSIVCHGRTASYPTAPAQIPACGTTALGSSEILASVKDKLVLPSLLFPAGRFVFQCNTQYGCLDRPYPTRIFTLQEI